MEQKLSRYQNVLVLLIALLLHAGILLSIIMIKFDQPQTEAMVMLAQDNEPQPRQTPQNDWVTTSQSMATQAPPSAMPCKPLLNEQNTPAEERPERSAPSLNEEQMQNAVSLAQKLLARAEKREVKKEEPAQSKKFQEEPVKQDTPQPQSPAITLAQLTQGFMQHMQESPMTMAAMRIRVILFWLALISPFRFSLCLPCNRKDDACIPYVALTI